MGCYAYFSLLAHLCVSLERKFAQDSEKPRKENQQASDRVCKL